MSIYQIIIAACAVLTVLAIYRVRLLPSFFISAALGALFMLGLFALLVIAGGSQ
jgi:hypothetical protein